MKFSKRIIAALALLLTFTTVFTEVAPAYAETLSSTEDGFYEELVVEGEESAKAVGSNGVEYDITYISKKAFNSLKPESQEAYIGFCDMFASLADEGHALENVVLATDKEGNVHFSATIPEFIFDEVQAEIFEAAAADISANEVVLTDVSDNDEVANDVSDNDEVITEEEVIEEVADDVTGNDEAEEVVVEETEEASDVTANDVSANEEEADEVIEENLDLLNIPEEEDLGYYYDADEIYVADPSVKNTHISNKSYYKNQLNSKQKSVYSVFEKNCIKGTKNSFSINLSYPSFSDANKNVFFDVIHAVSAGRMMYPNKFNYISRSQNFSFSGTYYYSSRQAKCSLTMPKSSYYSTTKQDNAYNKVKTLVADAYNNARTNNRKDTTYAIIQYLDKWLCANNYYDTARGVNGSTYTEAYYNCHCAYGALLNGYAVCESYAMAMTWCLDYAGITNMYVVSNDHAYVYVQMPNGKWYMLDTTWNDAGSSSSEEYLLSGKDYASSHKSTGSFFVGEKSFKFPALSTSKYVPTAENFKLPKYVILKKGGSSKTISVGKYYKDFTKSWSNSNNTAFSFSSSGTSAKIKALDYGVSNVTLDIAGNKQTTKAISIVYDQHKFTNNNKTKYSATYVNPDTSWDNDVQTYYLNISQKGSGLTAKDYYDLIGKTVKATSDKNSVAEVKSCNFSSGNTIAVTVKAKKPGKAKIKVSLNGKNSYLTYTVKQGLQASWFDFSEVPASYDYNAKSKKPVVKKTALIPKGCTYKVVYKNNKNAGTATVSVVGTGNYGNYVDIYRNFTINPIDVVANCKITMKSAVTANFNGKAVMPSITVKYKTTKLKKDRDYYITVNGSTTATPINAGTYTIRVYGKGNFKNKFTQECTVTVNKIDASKLKLSCSSSVYVKKNNAPVEPKISLKYGTSSLRRNTDYRVTYYIKNADGTFTYVAQPTIKGTYKAVITIINTGSITNTTGKTFEKTFKVVKKPQ